MLNFLRPEDLQALDEEGMLHYPGQDETDSFDHWWNNGMFWRGLPIYTQSGYQVVRLSDACVPSNAICFKELGSIVMCLCDDKSQWVLDISNQCRPVRLAENAELSDYWFSNKL